MMAVVVLQHSRAHIMRKASMPQLAAIVLIGASCRSVANPAPSVGLKGSTTVVVWQPSHQTSTSPP
jgi:hypothetical protein